MRAALALAALLAACGGGRISPSDPGSLRFRAEPPVTVVNDRAPTKAPPPDEQGLVQYYFRQDLLEPTKRAFVIGDAKPAANVNSVGDVPDSAWFTHRAPTPEELKKGPGSGGPDTSAPWHVIGVKVGGAAIGITIEDAKHDKYIIKFDEKGHAETETSADVVVQRLTWAFGYNVPENEVVTFRREQLALAPDAKIRDRAGDARKMTEADLEKYLGLIEGAGTDGTYRALASKFVAGKVLGGVEPEGTRADDPNDRVPHELRRDLRGQRLLWAWVNHIDLKSQNTLAAYEHGHLTWYAIDFGESLGVAARTDAVPRLGYRETYDLGDTFISLVTLGLYVHPWEAHTSFPAYRGLGYFAADDFDPGAWVPNHNWRPTEVADRFDELWAAEILMRMTPAHVAAAVDAGKYSDPRTRDYLVKTLLARQRRIGAYAFARATPLVQFAVDGGQVCFDDLWLTYAYGQAARTAYRTAAFDRDGRALGESAWTTAGGAHTCLAGARADAYTIVRIDVRRGDVRALAPIFVHVARTPDGAVRVVGVDRR